MSRVESIPLGFDNNFFHNLNLTEKERAHFSAKYNIRKPFFLSVGRLETKKNTANIIRAFDLIKKEADAALVLIGPRGRGFTEIEKSIMESPNKNDIHLMGWVETSELPINVDNE